jgi:hypothetical protein
MVPQFTELVRIDVHYMPKGSTPYLEGEWGDNDNDPLWWIDASQFWWIDPNFEASSIEFCIVDEGSQVLLCDVARIDLTTMDVGERRHPAEPLGLLANEFENMSPGDAFPPDEYTEFFKAIADRLRTSQEYQHISYLTLWGCWVDRDYEGEWDSGWDYLGHVEFQRNTISIIKEPTK